MVKRVIFFDCYNLNELRWRSFLNRKVVQKRNHFCYEQFIYFHKVSIRSKMKQKAFELIILDFLLISLSFFFFFFFFSSLIYMYTNVYWSFVTLTEKWWWQQIICHYSLLHGTIVIFCWSATRLCIAAVSIIRLIAICSPTSLCYIELIECPRYKAKERFFLTHLCSYLFPTNIWFPLTHSCPLNVY